MNCNRKKWNPAGIALAGFFNLELFIRSQGYPILEKDRYLSR